MEWLLDTFGARTTKIWPFEAARALRTATVAKAPRGLGGLPKQKCVLKVSIGGPADNPKGYYREGEVSFPTPKCPVVTQRSPGVVWLVLGPHHGDFHT